MSSFGLFLFFFVLFHWLGVEVIETDLNFFFAGRAAIGEFVHFDDTRPIVGLSGYALCKRFGFHLNEVAVHEEEALQGHRGGESFLGADVGRREIEELQVGIEFVAAHLPINRAALVVGSEFGRGTAERGIEVTGNFKDRIAQLLGFEALAVGAPIEAIAGILIGIEFVVFGRELIDRAQHDATLQFFDRHAVFHE